MKKAIVTIAIGRKYEEIAALTHPTIKNYAERIGADFICRAESDGFPHWQKFKIVFDLFKQYDRILYVDTDLIIRGDCPDLFEVIPEDKFGVFEEGRHASRAEYINAGIQMYQMPFDWEGKYYNTGVMVLSRYHREIFKDPPESAKHPQRFVLGSMAYTFLGEQTYLNIIMQKMETEIEELDYRFNRMTLMDEPTGEPRHASYIVHYAGCPNHEQMLFLIRQDIGKWKQDSPKYHYKRNIVISIGGGLGDQLCAEPVARYLIEKTWLGEDPNFFILSHWPRLFEHLKVPSFLHDHSFDGEGPYHIRHTMPDDKTTTLWNHVTTASCHMVDFSSLAACKRLIPDEDKQIQLKSTSEGVSEVVDVVGANNLSDLVLIHPGKGWPSKTFPVEWWQEIINGLIETGVQIGIIGKRINETQGYVPVKAPKGAVDFRDLLSLEGLISVIEQAKILVTNDSAPVHIAGAFDNWIVLLPTCKHPDYVLPYRKGHKYHKAIALYNKLTTNCVGSSLPQVKQTLDQVPRDDILEFLPSPKEVVSSITKIVDSFQNSSK